MIEADVDTSTCARALLDRANGSDQDLSLNDLVRPKKSDELLWVDIDCDSPKLIADVCHKLGVPASVRNHLSNLSATPLLRHYDEFTTPFAVTVEHVGSLRFDGSVLAIAAADNLVITDVERRVQP